MIDRLRELFRSDDFIPTSSIFPEIDIDKVGRDLKIKQQAVARGKSNQPASSNTSLDGVEMSIVERMEASRRAGLENYENNRSVYSQRLRSAHTARSEIETIAGTARGDFANEVKSCKGDMARIKEDLEKWNKALSAFRLKHGLDRPAYERAGLLKTFAIVLAFVMVETALNGILFAGKNELGLVGGVFIAFLISIVNVGISGLAGFFARFARYRYFMGKLLGYFAILIWLASAAVLNFAVAHFRDAVETLESWSVATQTSVQALIDAPFDLSSMESWLLLLWGALISMLTFLKFLLGGESYPGYARISERRRAAVEEFEESFGDAMEGLQERRDAAISELKEASDLVRERIADAVDALYGRRMMHGHLQAFLDQCNVKTTVLLKRYRDENRAARTTDAPAYFDQDYSFPPFESSDNAVDEDGKRRVDAEAKVEAVEEVVDKTIAVIHEEYLAAISAYADIEDLLADDATRNWQNDSSPNNKNASPAAYQSERAS